MPRSAPCCPLDCLIPIAQRLSHGGTTHRADFLVPMTPSGSIGQFRKLLRSPRVSRGFQFHREPGSVSCCVKLQEYNQRRKVKTESPYIMTSSLVLTGPQRCTLSCFPSKWEKSPSCPASLPPGCLLGSALG